VHRVIPKIRCQPPDVIVLSMNGRPGGTVCRSNLVHRCGFRRNDCPNGVCFGLPDLLHCFVAAMLCEGVKLLEVRNARTSLESQSHHHASIGIPSRYLKAVWAGRRVRAPAVDTASYKERAGSKHIRVMDSSHTAEEFTLSRRNRCIEQTPRYDVWRSIKALLLDQCFEVQIFRRVEIWIVDGAVATKRHRILERRGRRINPRAGNMMVLFHCLPTIPHQQVTGYVPWTKGRLRSRLRRGYTGHKNL